MALLIVESPAKAKTISKYLSKEFKIVASFGHIRDLPAKKGSVDPDKDFTLKYEVLKRAEKYVIELVREASKTSKIYLATDPDREGEAIAWNIVQVLKEKKAISDESHIYRIVFNEITKGAVQEAIENPRKINMDLVYAQQARRALDYLVGFNLSPLLWTKLSGSKSAGRVQSVVLKLICEREDEINKFIIQEYWNLRIKIQNSKGETFVAVLSHYNNKKLGKLSIKSEDEAKSLAEEIKLKQYIVSIVERKQIRRNQPPPFVTSSLQQDAVNKLHFSIKNTMSIAQKLYEGIDIGGEVVGLITYIRTDGFYIADKTISLIRKLIKLLYGDEYLPKSSYKHIKKIKNAQEAHEAIRPTDITRTPDSIKDYLTPEQFKLYNLIWKRTIASQMEQIVLDQIVIRINSIDQKVTLRASGSSVFFDGFYRAYKNSDIMSDDKDQDILPIVKEGEICKLVSIDLKQIFTQPPSRYNEASIVKKMEEIGIGRPSTYGPIVSILQNRKYVTLCNKKFIPSSRGKIVTIFLETFFQSCIEYSFTAQMEEKLDLISNGSTDWKEELGYFWVPFFNLVTSVKQMTHDEVFKSMYKLLVDWFCSEEEKEEIEKKCCNCFNGILKLNFGKAGPFLGCSSYPICNYTKKILGTNSNLRYPRSLGIDNATGEEVMIKKGPFGFYLGFNNDLKKRKTISIPKDINVDNINLNTATKLLSLPRVIGRHPETDEEIKIGLGKFGYYILYQNKYFHIKKNSEEVLDIQLDEVLKTIATSLCKKLKSIGFDENGVEIFICNGRYGLYIKYGKKNISLGKNLNVESIDLKKALEIIKERSIYKNNASFQSNNSLE